MGLTAADGLTIVAGETDLALLLATMSPELIPGEFVFVSVPDIRSVPRLKPMASVVEPEGLSLVLSRAQADDEGLPYDFIAAWITLRVHSSLNAVGLTAAVSTALAEAGVSCNVIAGYHHDHLLVPHESAEKALTILGAWRSEIAP